MSNLREIAALAGVSVATASRALKGQTGLAEATRARIVQLAAELGYDVARLRKSAVRRVCFLLHRQHSTLVANPFFSAVLQGVETACQDAGVVLTFLSIGPTDPLTELLALHQPDALLCAGYFEPEVLQRLSQRDLPMLLLDAWQQGVTSVNPDHRQGGWLATRHLLLQGRKVAFLSGSLAHYSIRERAMGYRQALFDAGMLANPAWEPVLPAGMTVEDAVWQVSNQLLDHPQPPDAIFAYNDAAALLLLQVARQRGLRVPQDLAIVGFDDIAAASLAHPALSTVRVDKLRLGQRAVALLLQGEGMQQEVHPVTLVVRASSSETGQ